MKKHFKNQAGSFTVEAALVMSAVIIVLSFFVLAFLLMYHKVLLTRNAIKTAREGANLWTAGDQGLYYRISEGFISDREKIVIYKDDGFEDQTGEDKIKQIGKKLQLIKNYAVDELDKGIIKPEQNEIMIAFDDVFSFREIVVEMEQEIRIPLVKWKAAFSGKESVSIHSEGRAVIAEPAEYIRNLDLVFEFAKKYDSISGCLSVLGNNTK